MGCACTKSDVVVKNQKLSNFNSSNSQQSKREIVGSNQMQKENSKGNSRELQNNVGISHNNIANKNNPRIDHGQNRLNRHLENQIRNANRSGNSNEMIISNFMNSNIANNMMPYLPSINDPNFNFPEISDVIVGSGLKRMKGYISPISIEDLQNKRDSYWGTRVEGNAETWDFLKNICENKDILDNDIFEFLNAAGVTPVNNCINLTYDAKGYYYEIPNYCINNPYSYEILSNTTRTMKPAQKTINVIVRKIIDDKLYQIKNTETIQELKEQVASSFFAEPIDVKNVRLFYGGKELKDEDELWTYNILNDSIILLMIREKF